MNVGRIGFAYNPTNEAAVELRERAAGWCRVRGLAHWAAQAGDLAEHGPADREFRRPEDAVQEGAERDLPESCDAFRVADLSSVNGAWIKDFCEGVRSVKSRVESEWW